MDDCIEIAPSIMSGDFGFLADCAKSLENAGANAIHIDIMDGHFVKNLTMGPSIVAAINRNTDLFLDVHLMMYNPFDYIEKFIEAGADRISFHFEATEDCKEVLEYIKKSGVEASLAFCPETSADLIIPYLTHADQLLLMTVDPGFAGQSFQERVLEKIRYIHGLCKKAQIASPKNPKHPYPIQVDGGINPETAKLCYKAGATRFVAGSYVFSQKDVATGVKNLQNALVSN